MSARKKEALTLQLHCTSRTSARMVFLTSFVKISIRYVYLNCFYLKILMAISDKFYLIIMLFNIMTSLVTS